MIIFRANNGEYEEGNDLLAEDISASHDPSKLIRHIKNDGVKEGDPYISFTEEIGAALLKYSYGKRRGKNGAYFYNKKRAPILLVDLPEDKKYDIDDKSLVGGEFFTEKDILEKFKGNNFSGADKETVFYKKVDGSIIHEVHPLLADVLFILRQVETNFKEVRNIEQTIIRGIISGDFNVKRINDIIQELIVNDTEKIFIEEFYTNRNSIVSSCERSLIGSEDLSIEKKIFDGTCLRIQILKDVFPQLVGKLGIENTNMLSLDKVVMPQEEDVAMSGNDQQTSNCRICDNVFVGGITTSNGKSLPCGMKFLYDESGKVIDYISQYREIPKRKEQSIERNKISDEVYGARRGRTSLECSHYSGSDAYSKMKREEYINTNVKNDSIRYIDDEEKECWAFDEDGYCLRCQVHKVGETVRLEVLDFVYDKDGKKSKYDGKGLDEKGIDSEGFAENGLDEYGCDRTGANENGVPRSFIIKKETIPVDFAPKDQKIKEIYDEILSVDEETIKEQMRASMNAFSNDKTKTNFQKSPIENLLTYIVRATLTSTAIMSLTRNGKVYEEEHLEESNIMFTKKILDLFGNVDNKLQGKIASEKNYQKLCDNFIRAAISVGKENNVDIKDIFEVELAEFPSLMEAIKKEQDLLAKRKAYMENKRKTNVSDKAIAEAAIARIQAKGPVDARKRFLEKYDKDNE